MTRTDTGRFFGTIFIVLVLGKLVEFTFDLPPSESSTLFAVGYAATSTIVAVIRERGE